ncbi:MAG: hypothetical protein WCI89_01540 [bacterium]
MSHPFAAMFEKALRKSRGEAQGQENLVLEEARGLHKKGYSPQEIYEVLAKLHRELLAPADLELVGEALDEFATYIGD